jgi:hypothetical protein
MAPGEDEAMHVSAAHELVAGDAGAGEKNGDCARHALRMVVECFRQVGQGEARQFPRAAIGPGLNLEWAMGGHRKQHNDNDG